MSITLDFSNYFIIANACLYPLKKVPSHSTLIKRREVSMWRARKKDSKKEAVAPVDHKAVIAAAKEAVSRCVKSLSVQERDLLGEWRKATVNTQGKPGSETHVAVYLEARGNQSKDTFRSTVAFAQEGERWNPCSVSIIGRGGFSVIWKVNDGSWKRIDHATHLTERSQARYRERLDKSFPGRHRERLTREEIDAAMEQVRRQHMKRRKGVVNKMWSLFRRD
jgi:hypothetical protein